MTAGKVYVRQPWADMLVSGRKRIETAHMRLPDRFAGVWLDVQTEAATIVGRVRFDGWIQWHTADAFDADGERHLVGPHSPYHFNKRRQTFGWKVAEFEPLSQPKPAQRMRSQFRLEFY